MFPFRPGSNKRTETGIADTINHLLSAHGSLRRCESPFVVSGMRLQGVTGPLNVRRDHTMSPLPITIYFLGNYPKEPPLVFVSPLLNTRLATNHRNVNAEDGRVYHEYIADWGTKNRGNILELLSALILMFEKDFPLIEREARLPKFSTQGPPKTAGFRELMEYNKAGLPLKDVKGKMVSVVSRELELIGRWHSRMLGELMGIQTMLGEAPNDIAKDIDNFSSKEKELEGRIEEFTRISEFIDEKNERLRETTETGEDDTDIDSILLWGNERIRELMRAVSRDLAYEDIEFILEKKLRLGNMGVGDYVKTLKSNSRNQFLERNKIHNLGDFNT